MKKRIELIFLAAFSVLALACATGSAVVTGSERNAIDPSMVKIASQMPTENFELIGFVTATSNMGTNAQEDYEYALRELKFQAAKIGANRIYIEKFEINANEHSITGKALYVSEGIASSQDENNENSTVEYTTSISTDEYCFDGLISEVHNGELKCVDKSNGDIYPLYAHKGNPENPKVEKDSYCYDGLVPEIHASELKCYDPNTGKYYPLYSHKKQN